MKGKLTKKEKEKKKDKIAESENPKKE